MPVSPPAQSRRNQTTPTPCFQSVAHGSISQYEPRDSAPRQTDRARSAPLALQTRYCFSCDTCRCVVCYKPGSASNALCVCVCRRRICLCMGEQYRPRRRGAVPQPPPPQATLHTPHPPHHARSTVHSAQCIAQTCAKHGMFLRSTATPSKRGVCGVRWAHASRLRFRR